MAVGAGPHGTQCRPGSSGGRRAPRRPEARERADHHWYYWLYGLERSCELASVARLQGRDWYYAGGLQLLAQQQANGSFRAEHSSSLLLDTTCFAVLFLTKSTPGVITGR